MLDDPRLLRSEAPLTDYGRVSSAGGFYWNLSLSSLRDVQEVVRSANRLQQPIRIRGSGHSMNGSSVPKQGEILLSTLRCRHFHFDESGTVTVGAGAAVWDVRQMLRLHGYDLLLCNDGGAAAPSLGGFASAGGIGIDSWVFGGFWETVAEILLLTGSGNLIRCTPGDELFRWVFGSMGQLGLIVEMKLEIRPWGERNPPAYPFGLEGTISQSRPIWDRDIWFTIFSPEDDFDKAREQLQQLAREHRRAWRRKRDYLYFMRFRTFNPPLLYPHSESFVAVGIWGEVTEEGAGGCRQRLQALERRFSRLVDSEPSYRRYLQSEIVFGDTEWASYFGKEIYQKFLEQKSYCDPNHILGRGSVFP